MYDSHRGDVPVGRDEPGGMHDARDTDPALEYRSLALPEEVGGPVDIGALRALVRPIVRRVCRQRQEIDKNEPRGSYPARLT